MRLTTPEISWHGKEPLFSLDFSSNNKSIRLATSGSDSNIRMWAVLADDNNGSRVEFLANLSRHTKTVNVVRFSPQGNMLASGGDDCYVIIWKLNEDHTDDISQFSNMEEGDIENKESWQVAKMLRGHIEDVYDLAWSPNATQLLSGSVDNSVIIWDTNKVTVWINEMILLDLMENSLELIKLSSIKRVSLKRDKLRILKDHRQYVQGVCWDPCGTYIASYSCDRTCRIYNTTNYRCCYNINKMTLPNKTDQGSQTSKQIRIFHDETMPSFFRRLTFSPDGSLLLVPGGKFEAKEKMINTTFVFTRASLNKPVLYFPATKKPTIAVKCCPILFNLRNTDKSNTETKKSVFKLPYRIVIAVASLDSVVLYDTQRSLPFGFLSNMHYASLTDIAWSSDGRILAISSRDGYCSLVTFDENELGIPYSQSASEVIENTLTVQKQSSPGQKTVTPRSKTPDSKVERSVSPKIENLSIKNFVTVNAPKSNARQTVNPIQTTAEPTPRRVGFVTVQSTNITTPVAMTTVSTTAQPRMVTTLQPSSSLTPGQTTSTSTSTQSVTSTVTNPASAQQARRVAFTTLQRSQSVTTAKTTPSQTQALNGNPGTARTSTAEHGIVTSTQQPRRVGFVTLQPPRNSSIPPRNSSIPQRNLPSNPSNQSTINPSVETEVSKECAPKIQHPPRRVGFVTIQPPQSSSISQQQTSPGCSTKQNVQSSVNEISSTSKATNQNQTVQQTLPISQTSDPKLSASVTDTNVKSKLTRQERPPVPLEPQVIIIND